MQYVIIDPINRKIVTGVSPNGRLTFSDVHDFSNNGAINITLYDHLCADEIIKSYSSELLPLKMITLKDYYTDPKYLLNS